MSLFKKLDVSDEKAPIKTEGETERIKCLIIGSGPAGYTAAIYASRANLNPVMYEGLEPGGQLTTTTDVENFPGYPEGVQGPEMMEDLKKQAARFGTDIRSGIATSSDLSSYPFRITIDNSKILEANALIIATGATAKYMGLESEKKYMGSGVSACATCDGFFYRNQDVAVVGGGDTAAEEALYLSGICRKVYLIIRKDYMRASKVMQERVMNKENIEVLFEHVTKEITGQDGVVTGALLLNSKGEEIKIEVTGFFIAIGHVPNSEIFKEYLDTDEVGYIKTKPGTTKTKVEGVFACGDVMDPHYRQAVTAAGTGCMAAMDSERFLGTRKF
ncbi:MAG: thioredoxin-disulfide reductase [Bacteroidales bacterium]